MIENDKSKLRELYGNLVNDNYDLPDFDTFERDMADDAKMRELYDNIKSDNYDVPDYNTFRGDMGYGSPTQPQQPTTPAQQVERSYYQMAQGNTPTYNYGGQMPPAQRPTKSKATSKPTQTAEAQPLGPEKFAKQMQFEQRVRQSVPSPEAMMQDFSQRMENIRKGNQPFGSASERRYNPETGEMETVYYTKGGDEVSTPMEQQQVNRQYDNNLRTREEVEHLSERIDAGLQQAQERATEKLMNSDAVQTLTDKDKNFFQKIGAAITFNNAPVTTAQLNTPEVQEYRAAQRMMRDAKRVIAEADHNAQHGTFGKWLEQSFAGGAMRGLGQRITDIDTWDFGMSDLLDNVAIMEALNKADKGEQLTESQQALLDAMAVQMSVNTYFGSEVGRGYKAGTVTAESVPFMLEMVLNPASGIGTSVEAKLTRYAIKRFGKAAVKKGGQKFMARKGMEIGGRVLGDVLGASTMAATTGSVRTTADAFDRMNNAQMRGEEMGYGEAFSKAFANTTIQNFSEMFGDYFKPLARFVGGGLTRVATSKVGSKIGLNRVHDFIENVGASDVARIVSDFEKHAKWNGTFGEYAEEVAGGVMNALVVGDQTLDADPETGVFNLDQNIDTFLGVSLLGGFMSGVKTVGYRTPKYRARKAMNEADRVCRSAFENEDVNWDAIRATLSTGNVAEVKSVLQDIALNPDYTEEQKRAVLDYASKATAYKGMLIAEQKRRASGEESNEQIEAEVAFDNGYDADEQGRRDIAIEYSMKPDDEVRTAAFEGVRQRIEDDADEEAEGWREEGRKLMHSDGSIRPALLKVKNENGEDTGVYIVSGEVVMTADGTMVDRDRTLEANGGSTSIVIYDPATGERRMIDPTSDMGILTIGLATSAEDFEYEIQHRRDEYVQRMLDEAQGTVRVELGQSLTMPDGREGTVMAISPDGESFTVVANDGSGEQEQMQRSDLQQIADAAALADYQARHQEEAAEQPTEEATGEQAAVAPNIVEGAPAEFLPNMEITILDDTGNEQPATVIRRVRYERDKFVPDENGNIVEYLVDGQVEHDNTANLAEKVVSYVDTSEAMPIEETEVSAGNTATPVEHSPAPAAATDTPQHVQGVQGPVSDGKDTNVSETEQEKQSDNLQTTIPQRIPLKKVRVKRDMLDENGNVVKDKKGRKKKVEVEEEQEDWYAATEQDAYEYLYNDAVSEGLDEKDADAIVKLQREQAEKELADIKKKPEQYAGSVMETLRLRKAREAELAEAQRHVDYWNNVKKIRDGVRNAEAAERAERDRVAHEAAVLAEQQRQAEELAKRQEQAARGSNAVAPYITERWNAAPKVEGAENEITLANGETVKGRYVLVESGAATASHNATNGFARSEGFPVDENGQTVNDRDYERDQNAQTITRQMADQYDSRAIQNVPVVSRDGVVLSGNGRTMAGELAAQNGTDGAYIEHLRKYPQQFGFTPEQVETFIGGGNGHPRVVFVPEVDMPYTTETFAKFNAQDMKSQSRTEQSVKLGKTVDDATFGRIVRSINAFDTLGDFYNDPKAAPTAIGELHKAGVINQMQVAEMMDGEKVSGQGRQMLENMLIGKAFEGNPDAVRQLAEFPAMRQSIVSALAEVANNIKLGEDYSLESEMAQAIDLAYQARKSGGIGAGEKVSGFARQQSLFPFDEGETVADYTNATVLMLADCLNDGRVSQLKKVLALYNDHAAQSAAGQYDIFSGGVKSKEEIIKDVLNILNNGTETEQQTALAGAAERRKEAAGVGQDGTAGSSYAGSGKSEVASAIKSAEAEVDTNPTEGQKKAGNYKMGHVKVDGYDITIENPKGSVRRGTDPSGKAWEQEMHNTYGYIKGTVGFDKDHLDIFLSDDPTQGNVYVVDQVKEDGTFDEHKVMYGFPDTESARQAYLSNYEEGWQGLGAITPVSKEEFKKWVKSSKRKMKPFSEYRSVETLGDVQVENGVNGSDGLSRPTAEQREIGGAMVDQLERMGFEVSTDIADMRRVRKQGEQDNSEAGKMRYYRTPDGKIYGFSYRGKVYLDPRRIDAELPIHEYAHPWCEAFRKLNPEGWADVVRTMQADVETWELVQRMNPDLSSADDIAEEMIALGSGKKGRERAEAEYKRMNAGGNFGNIWNNIAKAIQDFWKRIGDFLNIKYESAEQVYDQVVKDFANKINPRKRVEEYLRERDAEYMQAVERGDEARAKELFDEALRENIGNGVTPYVSVGSYRGNMDRLARGVKSRDPKVIAEVADLMAPIIPEDAVLVPAPSHSGEATDMLDVANAIAERTGVPVADVLRGAERGSQREAKRRGAPIASGDMGITMEGELPEGKIPVVIDNVVDSGNTAEACVQALGKGVVASLADAADRYRHVASLKSANAVVRDKNGNVVPLSKRFEMGGSGYLAKQKGDAAAAGTQMPGEAEKALRDRLIEVMRGEGGIEVITDEEGQRVLDAYRELAKLMSGKGKKRTPETASASENQKHRRTVVSSVEGAKIQKKLDSLAEKVEKSTQNTSKTFIGDLANALGAERQGSGSEYATFITPDGKEFTLRLANHNATVSNFDNRGEVEGISIVIAKKRDDNAGIDNDGNAHIVEFYYTETDLRKAFGKPLADIVRSVKEALNTGEYVDPTGLAAVHEVNAETLREMRAYHGSGADFDAFDHSHMGEGEGAQAYGWGTYVTEVEGIGKTYAEAMGKDRQSKPMQDKYYEISKNRERYLRKVWEFQHTDNQEEKRRIKAEMESLSADNDRLWAEYHELEENVKSTLYTVDIPDDNGSNYLEWNEPIKQKQLTKIASALAKEKGKEYGDYLKEKKGSYGENIYYELYTSLGSQQAASELLHSAGFVGIKYPAEYMSGGRSDGAKNYVIFNESDLKITDKTRFFRTEEGEVYGFVMDGKIYIDPKVATSETPIHEYTHLWTTALRKANPAAWERLKEEMRQQDGLMDYVRSKYPEIENEDVLAEEVFAHYSGRRGAERLRTDMLKEMAKEPDLTLKAQVANMFHKLRTLLDNFWNMSRQLFARRVKGLEKMSAGDFADMTLADLLRGFNPREETRKQEADSHKAAQLRAVVEANAMEDTYHTGIRSIDDIKTYAEAVREGEGIDAYPDYTRADAERAKKSGRITVYSSKPIETGVFVSASRMEAEEYAGGGRVYSKEVPLEDVAWLYANEGQYAKVEDKNLQDGVREGGARMQKGREGGIDLDEIEKIEARPQADGYVSGVGVRLTMTDGNTYNLWVQTDTDDGQRGVTEFYGNEDEEVPDEEMTKRFGRFFGHDVNEIFGSHIGSMLLSPRTHRGGLTLNREEIKQYSRMKRKGGEYRSRDGVQLTMQSLFEESNGSGLNRYNRLNGQDESGDLTGLRLRKLEEGETCLVERRYEENKMFSFTGKERIESMDDVAYIFKQLEDAAVENVFMAMVKDGKPTVIHIGMGSYAQSVADYRQAFAAFAAQKPDKVWMVHNHPSGKLKASSQDRQLLQLGIDTFGETVMQDGIIIDTVSGNYGVFTAGLYEDERQMPSGEDGEVPIKTYSFSRQVFAPGWNPREAFQITDSRKVAEFVSSHRLGEHKKMSLIVMNNQNQVVGNFFLPWTKLNDIKDVRATCEEMSNYVNLSGGVRCVLYGNYEYADEDKRVLGEVVRKMKLLNVPLLDVLHVEKGGDYRSENDNGTLEPDVKYGNDAYERWKADPEAYYGQPRTAVHREGEADGDISYGDWFDQGSVERIGAFRGDSRKRISAAKERQKRSVLNSLKGMTEKMHIADRVIFVESADELDGQEGFSGSNRITDEDRSSKGWYDPKTGKIVIVLGNHTSSEDVVKTLLHEAVAHYGLRQLFGDHFTTFLDKVYESAEESIRRRIAAMAGRHGWDVREGTEEYLSQLAEDEDFEKPENNSWWGKIKELFHAMLQKLLGNPRFEGRDIRVELTDNELRYILWTSYENLKEPGKYSYVRMAQDVAKQWELKVGRYEEQYGELHSERAGRWYERMRVAEPQRLHRDGDFSPRDNAVARDYYERMVSQNGYQVQEAMQDSMLGLRKAMQAILGAGKDFKIEEVAGNENAYLAENRMSSTNAAEQHNYFRQWLEPLLKAVHDIAGSRAAEREALTNYMMAKHGLERNEKFAERDFAAYQQQYPTGGKTLADFRQKDYAGLTALTGEKDVSDAEAVAQQMVADYESQHDTSELWNAVNTATKVTLAKMYRGGLMSKESYEHTRDMFNYYIPLRGFDETTSDEVYGYLTSRQGPLGSSILKHAEGRRSKADDPIATIAMMADQAIMQANRNEMKQRFLTFVQNHPSDLVSVSKLWLQYDAAADEWVPVFADIDEGDTAADVARKVEAFEQRMEQLAANDPDNYKSGKEAANIPYRVLPGNMNEHQVLVKRNGETYVLTINGNPRAAQALNGLTNPDVKTGGFIGGFMKASSTINRFLSSAYTTRTPDFVVSNFFRDMLYSNCMAWVKDTPSYALRFHKNFGRFNPVTMRVLFGKWENGTLDDSKPTEYMFKQFMMNGGETGYTNVRDIEAQKRRIVKELRRQGSVPRKVLHVLGEQLDLVNQAVENCARFAAFITSQELGRSLERSIYDAKEVSVNFNKKGSGDKMMGAKGQTKIGNVAAFLSGAGRSLQVFWNAGVQGMTNFGRAAKRKPGKFVAASATMFSLGAVIPLIAKALAGDGDDDDKNAYYNLPEYVRRSNICLRAGDQWITIPLPIEFRAIYGLGELGTGVITGEEHYSDSELARQMVAQVSQILPMDFMEGQGGLHNLWPSWAKPIVEAHNNKGWTGLPIYRDTPFNQSDPEFTKVYKSADKHLVAASKWLNELTGGDDYKKGWADVVNPAQVEYVLNGYFGGYFKVPNQLIKMTETATGNREFEWRNMMIANRLIKSGDERTAHRKLQNEYFKYMEEYEETKRLKKKYEKAADEGVVGYAEKVNFLNNSDEYARYLIFDEYGRDIEDLYNLQKEEADEELRKEYEAEYYQVMREMVDAMHAYEKSKGK